MLKKLLVIGTLLTLPLQGKSVPDLECPAYPVLDAADGYPAPYEAYPGIAYESSYTTTQLVTTVVVAVAFFAIVGVALTNTPGHHHGHHGHCASCNDK